MTENNSESSSSSSSFINLNEDISLNPILLYPENYDSDLIYETTSDVEYFKPDKSQLIYNGLLYNFVKKNKNDTIRWRCSSCAQCGLVTKDDKIIRHPNKDTRHKPGKCYVLLYSEKICLKKYEKLKHDARKPEFKFKQEYNKALNSLNRNFASDIIDLYWPNERTARSTINSIRQKYVKNQEKSKLILNIN